MPFHIFSKKRTLLASSMTAAGLAFAAGAGAMTAEDRTAGTATSPTQGLVPFSAFLSDLNSPALVSNQAKTAQRQHPDDIRQYLLKRYDGVAVHRSFVAGGQTFDCIPPASQPAFRGKGPAAVAAPPPFRPSQSRNPGNAASTVDILPDAVDSGTGCGAGTVPIRRITPEEIRRFGTLRRFFAKDLSQAAPTAPGQVDLAGTWVGTESQPGSPTPRQQIALTLNPVGAAGLVSGSSNQSDSGNPAHAATATLSGTLAGNVLTFDQKAFYLQTPRPGVRWCLAHARLTYSEASGTPTLTGNLLSAGCEPATVQMAKVAATHKYATRGIAFPNYGGVSTLSLWKPPVRVGLGQVFSLSQQWYSAGSGASTQTAEVGWQEYPQKYGTYLPVFFTYYTADDYNSTGCYNTDCGAYVQTNNKVAPGLPFYHYGPSGTDSVYSFTTGYFFYRGNWWVSMNDSWIGYYPASLYRGGPMSRRAEILEFGGEAVGAGSWPGMGSGRFPGGTAPAAFQKGIAYRGSAGGTHIPVLREQAVSNPVCYRVGPDAPNSGSYFYFGGPGGNNC